MPVRCTRCLLLWLLIPCLASANPFLQTMERATPAVRVVRLLNYFDTCRAVTQNQPYAFRLLRAVDEIGRKTDDGQLRRYCQYLKDTFPKHQQTNPADNAALFLAVGQRAADNDDPQIAAVCRHFAGQYYFLNEDYGRAFEHLLSANEAFRETGYERIPEISRYLYELALNYYYFHENKKVIVLLSEAAQYPPFNQNLAIQTYNTLALAYVRLSHSDSTHRAAYARQAERNYRKAQQVAAFYGDSVWVGIAVGNIGVLYADRQQWSAARQAFLTDYRLGRQYGAKLYYPNHAALSVADACWHLGELDSCRHYLDQSKQLYQQNLATPDFARSLDDERYLRDYYELSRRYYQATANARRADWCADSLMLLTDRINQRYNTRQIALVEQKLLIQQHQAEVAGIETEKNAERTLFWTAAAGLTLLAGLFFRLYYLSRVRRRQERVIEAQKEKSLRLEKQLVEDELGRAKADLAGFLDNLRQKDALIDTITAQLEDRTQPLSTDSAAHHKLMNSSLLTNDDWDEFRRRFERVHPGFFWQLKTQFSDISPAEERLLALSQLRIDTRQMSRMLGISPESLRKTKYRLRKKIGVAGHSSLSELLNEAPDGSVTS